MATREIRQPARRTFEQVQADGRPRAAAGTAGSRARGLVAEGRVVRDRRGARDRPRRHRRREGDEPAGRAPLAGREHARQGAARAARDRLRRLRALARRAGGRRARGRRRVEDRAKAWGKRAGYLGRAAIYAGLTYSTIAIVAGAGGGQSQNQKAHQTTATVLDWPAGRWLVGDRRRRRRRPRALEPLPGLARKFEDKWKTGEMSATQRRGARAVGLAGHVGALRRVRADRRLRGQGGDRLRPEGGDRPRRRAPEARARGVRAVAARPHRRRRSSATARSASSTPASGTSRPVSRTLSQR